MMAYIYQTNKQTGVTYVYENKVYWDKEKQQSTAKRKLIGKLDPVTQEIVPTRAYQKKTVLEKTPVKPGPLAISQVKRHFFGATYLFDQIGQITGVQADLKQILPDTFQLILSLAYYIILEENNSLHRFNHWDKLLHHPFGRDIPSQRCSEVLQGITEEQRLAFFKKQAKRRIETEYWAFGTTSISSYSETLSQVKQGRNKEHDRLPQLNLALLFDETSGLPFYYRKLPGNITDVSLLKQLLAEFDWLDLKKVKVVLDRGFYSRETINTCFKHHQIFLIGVSTRHKMVREGILAVKDYLPTWSHYLRQYETYGMVHPIEWEYEEYRRYKGDTLTAKRRVYLLIYYTSDKAAQEESRFNQHMTDLNQDLVA